MSVKGMVFLVNKFTRKITFAGDVPEVYDRIAGLHACAYEIIRDLERFGEDYIGLGFLNETDALAAGVTQGDIDEAKVGANEIKWASLEQTRFNLIEAQQWRIDRHDDEERMGRPFSEDIDPVLVYRQQIRDLTETQPDPFNIVWPSIPPLSVATAPTPAPVAPG